MPTALFSVYDKGGVAEFAAALDEMGWTILSSGGTAAAIAEHGVAVTDVAEVTGMPAILGHRVVTLHPRVHGGILADLTDDRHRNDLETYGIEPIDLVVVNLYPFSSDPGVELIDIGGPALVRAAAKNHARVGVVVDPADYGVVLDELRAEQSLSTGTRRRLAHTAFDTTTAYDAAIAAWLSGASASSAERSDQSASSAEPGGGSASSAGPSSSTATDTAAVADSPGAPTPADATVAVLPERLELTLVRAQLLRYGENPHQLGARYRTDGESSWWDDAQQHGGKELSYLNLFDTEAAWKLVQRFDGPACVIVKHANPCGVAIGDDIADAYERANACDPVSAFGGIVAVNQPVTSSMAEVLHPVFTEVVVAPGYDDEALELLTSSLNRRVLTARPPARPDLEFRSIDGGLLVQQPDPVPLDRSVWEVVTEARPSDETWDELLFAWTVCAAVSSNAIVLSAGRQAVGIGGGQQSRVDAARLAAERADGRAAGGAGASDAYFPFRDGLDTAVAAGIVAMIQPGGSVRDSEVIDAANEHGIAMVFTGSRHFRH